MGLDSAAEQPSDLVLAPFRGVRFAPDRISDLTAVTAPPYDQVDEDGVDRLLAAEAHNVMRLIEPRGADHIDDTLHPGPRAGALLRRWLADGILVPDPTPSLYVYEQHGPVGLQRGLIGALGLAGERAGRILPHEDVSPGPVQDLLQLMRATEANVEPIFLVYDHHGGGAASDVVDETADTRPPVLEATTADGTTHRLWRVADAALLDLIASDLRDQTALIADGHHRYAAYQALRAEHHSAGPWDYGLALLVDSSRYPPRLGAIHRVIPRLAPEAAARTAATAFDVEKAPRELDHALVTLADLGRTGPVFLLGDQNTLLLLTNPDPARIEQAMPLDRSRAWRRLDTSVLYQLLLRQVWEIEDPEASVRVVHDDARAALALAQRHGGSAVIVNPLRASDVFAVAAGGERVPHKSTSFTPRPLSGLVLRAFSVD